MTFSEYVKQHYGDYLRSVVPMAAIFILAPFVATLSVWFWLIAPLALLFMAGLVVWRQYNNWYPYYNLKDGLLIKPEDRE